jgi:hypothetical protein
MYASRPLDVLVGEVEVQDNVSRVGFPGNPSAKVDIAIVFRRADCSHQLDVFRVESLAEICGDGDNGLEEDVAAVDLDARRGEEADCMR